MDIDSVSFGAKPVSSVIVQKFNKKTKNFEDCLVNFVKLEPNNKSDIKAVDKVAQLWKGAKYIQKIATASHWMGKVPINIYALTTQKDKFERLKYSKILGLAEMRIDDKRPNFDWLYHLQVKPNAMNVNNLGEKTHKHVGTGILKSLKKVYKNICLYSEDSPNIEAFYKSNDFKNDYISIRRYFWTNNIFTKLKILWNNYIMKTGI